LIFSGALIDQRPDAHHPATAAEALLHLEQIQHNDKRNQLAEENLFNLPTDWDIASVSSPHNFHRVLHHRDEESDISLREIRSVHSHTSSRHYFGDHESIELSIKGSGRKGSYSMDPEVSSSYTAPDVIEKNNSNDNKNKNNV
jgi:hypothetical protein